ncbi:MAG: FAD/NAD(P)-binding oxidoreductase [Cyclobacteriaceae bacterium]
MIENNKSVVILGNGISGVTFARHLRKNNSQNPITIISGETTHFFSRTALMYIYMGHMKYQHIKPYEDWFWEKNNLKLNQAWVQKVDFSNKQLLIEGQEPLKYDVLVLAIGSKSNKFGWKGQDLDGVQGLYSIQDLEQMENNTKQINRAVIVGGGLIGIEMAEMLSTRNIPVTFLVRDKGFWDNVLPEEEATMIGKHIREHHIDLRLETELSEILDGGTGRVSAVKTKSGETIPCEFLGLTVGVTPNIDFLKESELETGKGILVDEKFQTNIPDVYAIGDCAEFKEPPGPDRKKIEQVWYTGRMHGETLAHNLTHKTALSYQPGVWFNSAKFFDIEYQTYGYVPPKLPEETGSFYWAHPNGKACLRLTFEKKTEKIKGVNALGWRLRHAFFEKAITEGWKLEKVLLQLHQANFNPEFFKPYHQEVLAKYNQETGNSLKIGKASFIQRLIGSRS